MIIFITIWVSLLRLAKSSRAPSRGPRLEQVTQFVPSATAMKAKVVEIQRRPINVDTNCTPNTLFQAKGLERSLMTYRLAR